MKTKNQIMRISSAVICFVLIAAIALTMTACGEIKVASEPTAFAEPTVKVVGEGETQFNLTVVDGDGNEQQFIVKTDETTVGAALVACGLVEGENSEYGLYIKKVNGITADYDVDGTYWSFYIDGEYAMTGADSTEITAGTAYSLKVEK